MFTWKGLSFLTSPLGEPKKLHLKNVWAKKIEEARVFVEVDLEKKLPECFSFKSNTGVDYVVYYDFPWLPPKCRSCAKWGHETVDCRVIPGDKIILKRNTEVSKENIQDKTVRHAANSMIQTEEGKRNNTQGEESLVRSASFHTSNGEGKGDEERSINKSVTKEKREVFKSPAKSRG